MGLSISGGGSIPSPFKQNTPSSITGTTMETIISSYFVPAGTFKSNDWLEILSSINTSNNSNTRTIRAYFNTSASINGAILFGTRLLGLVVTQNFSRNLFFKNSISSQRTLVGATTNISVDSDGASTSGNASDLGINFAVDQYFIISGQLTVASDIITLNGLTSLIRR